MGWGEGLSRGGMFDHAEGGKLDPSAHDFKGAAALQVVSAAVGGGRSWQGWGQGRGEGHMFVRFGPDSFLLSTRAHGMHTMYLVCIPCTWYLHLLYAYSIHLQVQDTDNHQLVAYVHHAAFAEFLVFALALPNA